ncbi:vasa-like protein [Penaeus vannamei]|uniref:RNA helicase n=1 Tax=Penaeus vannamei TaxID=6689 RepID=A0A3R7P8M9_PENVA|nr:vasa-like protein [Penaeus vannamei]
MLHYILDNNCPSNAFEEPAQPTGLVICPTRELAIQIMREARKFSHSSVAKCCVAYGGAAGFHQLKTIHSGCHILVATPGRLLDFLEKGKIVFSSLKYLVLDEADRMLDMGFLSSIKTVINHKTMTPTAERITLMFSATFPHEIQELASAFLNNYLFVVVGTVGAANTDVKQEVLCVPKFEKKAKLVEMCEEILISADDEKILVFVEQKRVADFVGTYLCEKKFRATTMHGDRYQAQREQALSEFRTGVHNILVATAVAARGLDIKGIGVVVNYDLPKDIDEYVHRIGRTGRLGNRGLSISFYDDETDACLTKDLVKVLSEANQTIPDWLTQKANASGHAQTYHGSGLFASSDIRSKSRQSHLRVVYERMERALLAQDSSPAVDAVVVAGPGPMRADFLEGLPRRWHPLTLEQPVTTTRAGPTGLQQLVAHMKEACSTVKTSPLLAPCTVHPPPPYFPYSPSSSLHLLPSDWLRERQTTNTPQAQKERPRQAGPRQGGEWRGV